MKIKLVNTHTGFNLGEILANHRMTVEEAAEILGVELMNTYEDYAAGNGENINELELFPAYRPDELKTIAANLYDGGWRAEDGDEIISEYLMCPEDVRTVCGYLAEYAKTDLEKRYSKAIKALGGAEGLMNLPNEVKEALKSVHNFEVKTKLFELIAEEVQHENN